MVTATFSSSLSTELDSARAEGAVLEALRAGLGGVPPDLLVAFATHHHGTALERLLDRLADALGAGTALGCTGQAVIGAQREAEGEAGLSVFAAHLPDTAVRGFAIETGIDAAGEATLRGELPLHDPTRASAILLGDPFSLPVEPLLQRIGEEAPGLPVIGGLASGGHGPGQNLLLQREGVRSEGGVGVILEGRYSFRPVVSQGCRPVGRPFVITASEENVILRLGGKPALDGLLSTLEALPPEERELMQRAPFLGLAVDPAKSEFERGDFLVRGLLGIRPQDRSLVVADQVRRGQTVQFLVRDTHSAGEDLERLLAAAVPRRAVDRAQGALLFSCSGRGRAMFGERDHDVRHLRRALGPDLALAGFFAGGELGPVAGRNFLHGFTASVALLVDRL